MGTGNFITLKGYLDMNRSTTYVDAGLAGSTVFPLTFAKILDRVSRLPSYSSNFLDFHLFTGMFLTVGLLANSSTCTSSMHINFLSICLALEIVSAQNGLHGFVCFLFVVYSRYNI